MTLLQNKLVAALFSTLRALFSTELEKTVSKIRRGQQQTESSLSRALLVVVLVVFNVKIQPYSSRRSKKARNREDEAKKEKFQKV
jgi:oligoribonuclease NrnB/cAMP/cGMP phosphodiesterase (DHH superfamily)|tara:strand:+ start:1969 stop:2223 length:255 start_codon:yes stop_codon:yes gene_type:complete